MPADEYGIKGGGALRLKGGRVDKPKKKKKTKDKDKVSSLEKQLLSTGEPAEAKGSKELDDSRSRLEEDTTKEPDEGDERTEYKTEAERAHEEFQRKKLLELAKSSRPELLKTHKERVEELNTYLSKLSEHHDMPKIGPG